MGLLSMFFGGGKSKQAKTGEKPAAPGADMIRVATPPQKGLAHRRVAAPPAAAAVLETPKGGGAAGYDQVRLRMMLFAAQRAGDFETAYEAALGLEAIQLRAGRRVGARIWRDEADRLEASF